MKRIFLALLLSLTAISLQADSTTVSTNTISRRVRGFSSPPATCTFSALVTDFGYDTTAKVMYVCTASNTWTAVSGASPTTVANGGTGRTSLTAFAPLFGGTTATGAVQSGTLGNAGWVLTSNGAGVLPTFQAPSAAPFSDNAALVSNSVDPTKLAILSAASITTGTTRTYTLPDENAGLATTTGATTMGTATTQTFNNSLTVLGSNIRVGAAASATGSIVLLNATNTRTLSLSAPTPNAAGSRGISLDWSAMTAARTWIVPNGNVDFTPLVSPTGTGNAVLDTSPTITTPTIASFVNATHNHSNAAGGGTIAFSALTGAPIALAFDASTTGNTAATETDIRTTTLTAGQLSADGQSVRFDSAGSFAGTLATNKRIIVYFGGTAILDSGSLAITSANTWRLSSNCYRDSPSSVKCSTILSSSATGALTALSQYATVTGLTLSNAQVYKITGNGTNANDVTAEVWKVAFDPAP